MSALSQLQGAPHLPVLGSVLLVDVAARGALLLLLAWAAVGALGRASAAARHLVWTAGFVGVLVLPLLASALPEWRVPVLPSLAGGVAAVSLPAPGGGVPTVAALPSAPGTLPGESPGSRMPEAPWSALALAAWALGVALHLAALLVGARRVRIEAQRARPLDATRAAAVCRRLAGRLGIGRPVRLLEGGEGAMPITWGVLRPSILLPAGAERWPAGRLEAVLLHELAHVRRGDCLVQLLAQTVCALHWFNPLAWIGLRRLRLEAEHASDDRVIRAGAHPADYAGHLVEVARAVHAPRLAPLAGVPMARRSQLRARVHAVLVGERRRAPVPLPVAALSLLAALGVAGALAVATPVRTALAAPAGIAPTACRPVPGAHANVTDLTDGRTWKVEWSEGRCMGEARITGRVRFSSDSTDVAGIAPGGSLTLELRNGQARTRARLRPGRAGELNRAISVDGRSVPWGREAERWLAQALPELLRRTAYHEARVRPEGEHGFHERFDRLRRALGRIVPGEGPEAASGPGRLPSTGEEILTWRGADGEIHHATLRARQVRITAGRDGIERIAPDGYLLLHERGSGGERHAHLVAGPDGRPVVRSLHGDFAGDPGEWLAGTLRRIIAAVGPTPGW